MKCLDTYPLIEISSGNNKFLGFLNEKIIIPNLILIEFYGLMYRKYNLKTAEYWYNKLLQFKVDVSIEILKKAIIFKNDNNKSNISFFDAVGYIYACENNLVFVTGDKEFKNKEGVEFVSKD